MLTLGQAKDSRSVTDSWTVSPPTDKRYRATKFLEFLKQIDARAPGSLDVNIIVDNYATHKMTAIKTWLTRHRTHARTSRLLPLVGSVRLSGGSPD